MVLWVILEVTSVLQHYSSPLWGTDEIVKMSIIGRWLFLGWNIGHFVGGIHQTFVVVISCLVCFGIRRASISIILYQTNLMK